jgi:MFS family permease
METQEAPFKDRVGALLRQGPFARYMAGEAVSMTGTWMQVMAQSWVMTGLTDKASMLGIVNFATGFPMVLLTMHGGLCADRYDKRRILLITQVVQIVLALSVGSLVATGKIQIWHIVCVAALLGVSNSFEMPAASALVPELVGQKHVATAIAMDRSVFHGTRLIGPALAGGVIGLWGAASAFYLNAISFLALIAAIASIQPRPRGSPEEENLRRGGMKDGIAHVRSDKPTLAMIGLMALTTVFVFPVMIVMLPIYARHWLELGPHEMGLLMGMSATGSLTGSIGLLAATKAHRPYLLFGAPIGASAALLGLGLTHRFFPAAASLLLLSLSVSTLVGLANTVVQERAPGPLRGRVSAIASLSFFGLMPFAGLGITTVSDWLGIARTLIGAAICYVTCALLVLLKFTRR